MGTARVQSIAIVGIDTSASPTHANVEVKATFAECEDDGTPTDRGASGCVRASGADAIAYLTGSVLALASDAIAMNMSALTTDLATNVLALAAINGEIAASTIEVAKIDTEIVAKIAKASQIDLEIAAKAAELAVLQAAIDALTPP